MNDINNAQDIIDSRDVIARIQELEDDAEAFTDDGGLDDDDAEELKALRALAEEAEGYAADWHHGEALIRDSYFVDYARQLADDQGCINADAQWPTCHIDWEAAADSLKQDYTCVDFDGIEYWVR